MLQEGKTYIHEHITIDLSEQKNDEDCCLDAFEQTVKAVSYTHLKLAKKEVKNG